MHVLRKKRELGVSKNLTAKMVSSLSRLFVACYHLSSVSSSQELLIITPGIWLSSLVVVVDTHHHIIVYTILLVQRVYVY
jgi:hypothetical protein